MSRDLFINTDAGSIETAVVAGLTRPRQPVPMWTIVEGETQDINLYLVKSNGTYDSLSGSGAASVKVSITKPGAKPSSGSFTITDAGAAVTSAIPYGASGSAVEDYLNALNAGTGPDGALVDVYKISDSLYSLIWRTVGARTTLTANSVDLTPESTVTPSASVTGTATTRAQQVVEVRRQPAIYTSSWTTITSGFSGTLDANTARLAQAVADDPYGNFILEVSVDGDALARVPCRVASSGMTAAAFPAADLPDALDEFAANPNSNGNFSSATWATALGVLSEIIYSNVIFVAKSGTDTRTGLDVHDFGNPFLTCTAALAAATSGDTIHVFAGDYSAESALGGKDGVDLTIEQGAISPSFDVIGAFTFTIDGDIGGNFRVRNASANVVCKGDVGSYIQCDGGTQTAGNAGTYIYCANGTQIAGNAGTVIECANGTQIAGNAGTYIRCNGGTQTVGNAGTFILCLGGTQTINNANNSHDGTSFPPIYLTSSGSLTINNSRIESTESGGDVVEFAASWSGTFIANNCAFVNTTASSKGISYGATVTGNVQLHNPRIITGAGGVSIDAPSAQTVYIQGILNQTHAFDAADITLSGGSAITNTGFKA